MCLVICFRDGQFKITYTGGKVFIKDKEVKALKQPALTTGDIVSFNQSAHASDHEKVVVTLSVNSEPIYVMDLEKLGSPIWTLTWEQPSFPESVLLMVDAPNGMGGVSMPYY